MFSNTNILHKVHLMYTLNIHQGIGVYLVYTLCIQIVYKTEVHFGKGGVSLKIEGKMCAFQFTLSLMVFQFPMIIAQVSLGM